MANFELIKSETLYDDYLEHNRELTLYYASREDYVEVDSGGNNHAKVKTGIMCKGASKRYPDGAWIVGFGSNINHNGFILHITGDAQTFEDRISAVKKFKQVVKKYTSEKDNNISKNMSL